MGLPRYPSYHTPGLNLALAPLQTWRISPFHSCLGYVPPSVLLHAHRLLRGKTFKDSRALKIYFL